MRSLRGTSARRNARPPRIPGSLGDTQGMARRRRFRLRPALVLLGLALAVSPLVWEDGDGPVEAVFELVTKAIRP